MRRRVRAGRGRLIVIAVTLTLVSHANADPLPARFGKYEQRLLEFIRWPDTSGPVRIPLACGAHIRANGTVGSVFCDGEQEHPLFHAAVSRLNRRRTRIEPAVIRGKKTPVRLQFQITFINDDAGRRITLAPNHGQNAESLGQEYVSPQRYDRPFNYTHRCPVFYDVTVSGLINETGEGVSDAQVESSDAGARCTASVLDYFTRSRYIPGFVDSNPAPMRLTERFWVKPPT